MRRLLGVITVLGLIGSFAFAQDQPLKTKVLGKMGTSTETVSDTRIAIYGVVASEADIECIYVVSDCTATAAGTGDNAACYDDLFKVATASKNCVNVEVWFPVPLITREVVRASATSRGNMTIFYRDIIR